jgi:hypothetical protein
MSILGGLLNLARLATDGGLLVLFLAGLGSTGYCLVREKPWRDFPRLSLESAPMFLAPLIAVGAALLLLPAGVFNISDDFHTYIARAARMTQTGSVGGNAFDTLGVDSLGSPSLFHGLFLIFGGVPLLNGFDAVACFALCLLLLAEVTVRWRLPWWLGVAAMAALTWLNPQYVNISPLYAGAGGIMVLLVCGVLLARSLARTHAVPLLRLGFSIGLVTGWLAAMKITLAAFAGIFLVLLLAVLLAISVRRRPLMQAALASSAAMGAGILPWALVAWPALLRARNTGEGLISLAPLATKYSSVTAGHTELLVQPVALMYGDTPVYYLGVCAAVLALGVAGLSYWSRHRNQFRAAAIPALAVAGAAMLGTLLLNSHTFPITTAIRYVCPVAIGGAFILGLAFVHARTKNHTRERRGLSAGVAAGCLVIVLAFHSTFVKRMEKATQSRTLIAFGVDQHYQQYCQRMMSLEERAYHLVLQTNIPAGSTVLVWSITPFHFDFTRNQLFTMTVPGITSPALQFPAGAPLDTFQSYLRDNNIRYVIYETNGYGVTRASTLARMQQSPMALYQKIGDFGSYAMSTMNELSRQSKTVFSDDRMVVFELKDENAKPATKLSSL